MLVYEMTDKKNISDVLTEIDSSDDFLDDTIDIDTIDVPKDEDEYYDEDIDDDDDESFNRRWYQE